ncbi:TetR family transcriptional regulator [Paenibacillus radicis (ex Gao et al. 2016)]|uniref:TetR family transcriptional regulator n=2 Tax=Paenibacillus radicis (ex Gao et al. 2016) TaxID=1737354 RepID=A0A917HNB1_9BACL|nr:TetR family transcriptional regulator [Paenibacillus radicis (ex Gao et al. 2016)]
MFADSGYEGTSMSEIAKAVGIKTPSIYAHFKSKEQLFLQLTEEGKAEEQEAFQKCLKQSEEMAAKERIEQAFDFFTDFSQLTAGQSFLKRSMMVPPRHLRDQLRINFMAYESELNVHLEQLFIQGIEEGLFPRQDVKRMVAQFYNAIDGLMVEYQIYDDLLFHDRKRIIGESLMRMWTAAATT